MTEKMSGYIYVMESEGWPTDCYKIGFSKDPVSRLKYFTTGNPHKIKIAYLKYVEDMRATEKAIHQHLDYFGLRYANEFFKESLGFLTITIDKVLLRFEQQLLEPPQQPVLNGGFIIVEQSTGLMNGVFGFKDAQKCAILNEDRYEGSSWKIFADCTPYVVDQKSNFPPERCFAPIQLMSWSEKKSSNSAGS